MKSCGRRWVLTLPLWVALLVFGCVAVETDYSAVPAGRWRGVVRLESNRISANPKGKPLPEKLNLTFDEVTAGELPFLFDVVYQEDGSFYLAIQQAEGVVRTETASFGRSPQRAKDTVAVIFPRANARLEAYYEENLLEGVWIVEGDEGYRVPFVAWYGQGHLFTNLRKPPAAELSGKWSIRYLADSLNVEGALVFRQQGNELAATFTAGDKQWPALSGTIQEDKIYLSYFDGKDALLIEAKVRPDGSLIGSFRQGLLTKMIWEARRTE